MSAASSRERAAGALLRALPDRPAPAGLEARVRAELARRSSLPWWRRSFAAWPAGARGAFLAAAGASGATLALGAAYGARTLGAGAWTEMDRRFAWIGTLRAAADDAGQIAAVLAHSVPRSWLAVAAAGSILAYAALARAGVALYRARVRGPLLCP